MNVGVCLEVNGHILQVEAAFLILFSTGINS